MTSPRTHPRPRPDRRRPSVAEASLALREVFGSIPADHDVPACPHCLDRFDLAAVTGPLDQLSLPDAARLVLKAGTTWGRPEDLRRLVPVVLPALADHQLPLDRRIVWTKLRWAGWPAWPQPEVDAVLAFLLAEWERLLRSRPRPAHRAHRWLADNGDAIEDLGPFLVAWHDALGPLTAEPHQRTAAGHLVALLCDSPLRPDLPDTLGEVFPGSPATTEAVRTWLLGPGTAHELQRAVTVQPDAVAANRAGLAHERLRRFAAATNATRA